MTRMNTDQIELGDIFVDRFNMDDTGEERVTEWKVIKATHCTVTLQNDYGKILAKKYPYQVPGIEDAIFVQTGIYRSARFTVPDSRK